LYTTKIKLQAWI